MKDYKKILLSILLATFSLIVSSCENASNSINSSADETKDPERTIVIGIAWKCNDKPSVYESTISAIESAGAKTVVLNQVICNELAYKEDGSLTDAMIDYDGDLIDKAASIIKNKPYDKTNIEDVIKGIDGVIFLGGEDISPSLLSVPEDVSNGNDPLDNINPTRDVSDYMLMNYCLDNDIPFIGICRGMQMLAIISGGKLIQDIPRYYEACGVSYDYYHRKDRDSEGNISDYSPHDVNIIDKESIVFNAINLDVINDAPSWHHQAVDVSGCSNIIVSGTSTDKGITISEIIERNDVSYAIGYQFHPEAVFEKINKQENWSEYTSVTTISAIYNSFIEAAR